MDQNGRNIVFIGIEKTHSLENHVKHHIERWIKRQQSLLFYPKTNHYQTTIIYEEETRSFTCQIELSIGDHTWTSFESARTLQESVVRAVHRLRSVRTDTSFGAELLANNQVFDVVA